MINKLLIAALIAISFPTSAQVGVGIGTDTPEGILDIVSTNSGLIIPRVANIGKVTMGVEGMMVFDVSEKCFKGFQNGAWTACGMVPAHYNGITAEVSIDHTLATYYTGETFDGNTICADKEISAQGCGALTTVIGASGTVYNLIDINGQCWMTTNLKEVPSNFSDSGASWVATDPSIISVDKGYWGYYNTATIDGSLGWGATEPAAGEGFLYQWSAAMNNTDTERSGGVCPTGFHIPSDCEWMYLEHGQGMALSEQVKDSTFRSNTANSQGIPGIKLLNQDQETNASANASGFSGLFSGYRNREGYFEGRGTYGTWWSSSTDSIKALVRDLDKGELGVYRYSYYKGTSFSVRCLKD
jgi:uncharacterized protein (TIGR02145 family)